MTKCQMHKYFYKINVLNIKSKKCWEKCNTFKYETKSPVDGGKLLF